MLPLRASRFWTPSTTKYSPAGVDDEHRDATDFDEWAFSNDPTTRRRERSHGGVNGDLYPLVAHRETTGNSSCIATVTASRRDDVASLHGRIIDSVIALAPSTHAPRRLHVDVTRPRADVTTVYRKHDVRDPQKPLIARAAQRKHGLEPKLDRGISRAAGDTGRSAAAKRRCRTVTRPAFRKRASTLV